MKPAIAILVAVPFASSPVLAACVTQTSTQKSSGQFGVLNGTIYGSDQQPFVARGINLMEGDFDKAALIPALFPGVNFVRLPVYTFASPEKLQGVVNTLTSKGIVVELEDHTTSTGSNSGGGQGGVFTGQQLQNELAWYSSIAAAFKGNPYVWFGTNNEPPGPAGLSQWHKQTYDAIRSTGNNAPILIDPMGGGFTDGLDPSVYAGMSNIVGDVHFYGWAANFSADQGTVNQSLAGFVSEARAMFNGAPVIIGEYGDSTTGQGIDPNWRQVINAVHQAAQSGQIAGSAAWAFSGSLPADNLLSGNGLSALGELVASGMQAVGGLCPSALPGAVVSLVTAVAPAAVNDITSGIQAFAPHTASTGGEIAPASGSLADAAGNAWTITSSGSIQQDGQWVPGGGGTAALKIVNGVVYGLDAHGRGWFVLSGDGEYWSPSSPPPGATPSLSITAHVVPGTGGQAPITGGSLDAPGGASLSIEPPASGFVSWYPAGESK